MTWDELGIAATADPKVIRSAYALRLKGLDVDRDPAAFIRLRQAYEAALSAPDGEEAAQGQVIVHRRPTDDPGFEFDRDIQSAASQNDRAPDEPGHPREDLRTIPYGAFPQFCEAFEEAIGAGLLHHALTLLEGAMARGIIPIGSVATFVHPLADKTLADQSLSASDLDEISKRLNVDRVARFDDPLSLLARNLLARAEAERWYSRIEAEAGGRWWTRFTQRARVARVILGQGFRDLEPFDLRLLRSEAEISRRHAPWLFGRVDPDRAAQLASKHWMELSGIYTSVVIYGLAIVAAILLAQHFPLN